MSDAPWWNPDAGVGAHDVVRHAADLHSYRTPDAEQARLIGGGPVKRFATIPASRHDGTSYGFNPTVAGPVVVDPDAPDGGVIFDPRSVNKDQLSAVVAQSEFPHQPFYRLGQPVRGSSMPLPPINPSPPSLAPAASPSALRPQPLPHNQSQPQPQPQPQPQAQPQAQPQYYTPPEQFVPPVAQQPPQTFAQPYPYPYPYPPPAPAGLSTNDVQAMIAASQSTLMDQLRSMFVPPPSPPVAVTPTVVPYDAPSWGEGERLRPIRAPKAEAEEIVRTGVQPSSFVASAKYRTDDDNKPQTVKQYTAETTETPVITGFETLNLHFVNGPLPKKPKVRVVFNYGHGRCVTQYHDVIIQTKCIVLVYDTRYQEGQQYQPIEDPKQVITIELQKAGKTFTVSSMGLAYSMGVFDIVVLVRTDSDEEEVPEDDDE